MASEAETPPMVGSVSTEMKGSPASPRRVRMALVLAICMSEVRPSCMRAPPLAEKQTKGVRSASAYSAPSTKRSPTTEPIEPPMKSNSKAAAVSGRS